MLSLIRRISSSVIPRPDRPWEDDPTSNAPQIGRKRRLSSVDRDPDEGQDEDQRSNKKKVRGESTVTEEDEAGRESSSTSLPREKEADTEGVKEVTNGVKEVELVEPKPAPESVPLPEGELGELDDANADASAPPEPQAETQNSVSANVSPNAPETSEKPEDTSSGGTVEDTRSTDREVVAPVMVRKPISKGTAAAGGSKKPRSKSRTSKKVEENAPAQQ